MSAVSLPETPGVSPREVTNNKNKSEINSSSSVASGLQNANSGRSIVSKLTGFGEETQKKCPEKLMIR